MKKSISFILLIIFLMFISTNIVYANVYFGNVLGGRIKSSIAEEIENLQASGYSCPMDGTSISITPIGSPSGTPAEYFIPSYVTPMTRTSIRSSGQLILGKYSGETTIECTRPTPEGEDIKTVILPTITLFGTSR
jgi:hypothetical protein